jgi:hypothetical protein
VLHERIDADVDGTRGKPARGMGESEYPAYIDTTNDAIAWSG